MSISKSLNIGALLIAGIVLVVANDGGHEHHKIKCLDQEIDLSDCFKGWMECVDELFPDQVKEFHDPNTTAERKKELHKMAHENTCVRVCQWKKHQHFITADNSMNHTVNDEMLKKFPEATREPMKTGTEKCFEEHSKEFSDADHCKGYKPFEKCLEQVFMKECKVKEFQME